MGRQNLNSWLQWIDKSAYKFCWCCGAVCDRNGDVCKYSRKKPCIKGGCHWTRKTNGIPANHSQTLSLFQGDHNIKDTCPPCSDQKNKDICTAAGCLWNDEIGTCTACANLAVEKCTDKGCVIQKTPEGEEVCTSCESLSYSTNKCIKARCARISDKKCAPCSTVIWRKQCHDMDACVWKDGACHTKD